MTAEVSKRLREKNKEFDVKKMTLAKEPERFLERAITRFVQDSPANRRKVDGGKFWDHPLVGFASGEDPLFKQYKKILEASLHASRILNCK
jgi:hypothetical protein